MARRILLTELQETTLVKMLDPEKKSAYDLGVTMNTMKALKHLCLIKRTNPDQVVWLGWERSGSEWALTESGKEAVTTLLKLHPKLREIHFQSQSENKEGNK